MKLKFVFYLIDNVGGTLVEAAAVVEQTSKLEEVEGVAKEIESAETDQDVKKTKKWKMLKKSVKNIFCCMFCFKNPN